MAHRNVIRSCDELLGIPPHDNEYAFYPGEYQKGWKIHLCLNREQDIYKPH